MKKIKIAFISLTLASTMFFISCGNDQKIEEDPAATAQPTPPTVEPNPETTTTQPTPPNNPVEDISSNCQVNIIGGGDTKGIDGKGYIAHCWCGKDPESWVRGNATFDKSSGVLSMTVGLETDATDAGPKGRLTAIFKDGNGNKIAEAKSIEVGTGGKKPGKATIRQYSSIVTIDPTVSKKVCEIQLIAECTGSESRIFNINESDAKKAFEIAVQVF